MIKPHGSNELNALYVSDSTERVALITEANTLPSIDIDSTAAANAVMLGSGYFNPLTGFMNLADCLSVSESMTLTSGLFWPTPVANRVASATSLRVGQKVALKDPNVEGNPAIAIMVINSIDEASDAQIKTMASQIFGSTDTDHPGVATFTKAGKVFIGGDIQVLNYSYFKSDFPDTFRTASQIRDQITANNWETIVAFQTRNPMHLAHEELCRIAMQRLNADGCVIHMLLGQLKPGDIPADVRDACIRTMADVYFPVNSVMVTGYGFDMLYAGPREAVLHAIFRQNMGATHLIVGRDHAGVGDYYGAFDAQTIFDTIPEGTLEIEIFNADHTAWSKKLNRVVMMREAPDHAKDDFVLLSGTKVREMLSSGIAPPPEFSRPEVSQILIEHYQIQQ
ncbi:MAG TPA: sulfate adenylyltransferase [Gammaproteobacteria bacterium]|nr:sulfate adenylyltransferase [Gammaproteobacteria bacterium]